MYQMPLYGEAKGRSTVTYSTVTVRDDKEQQL